jgi:hypothetical protein
VCSSDLPKTPKPLDAELDLAELLIRSYHFQDFHLVLVLGPPPPGADHLHLTSFIANASLLFGWPFQFHVQPRWLVSTVKQPTAVAAAQSSFPIQLPWQYQARV